MLDREKLNAARVVLGIEKRASVPGVAAATTKDTAVKAGRAGLQRLFAGKEESLRKLAHCVELSQGFGEPPMPPTSQELRQFARHGISPAQLNFLPTLSGMRKDMSLE